MDGIHARAPFERIAQPKVSSDRDVEAVNAMALGRLACPRERSVKGRLAKGEAHDVDRLEREREERLESGVEPPQNLLLVVDPRRLDVHVVEEAAQQLDRTARGGVRPGGSAGRRRGDGRKQRKVRRSAQVLSELRDAQHAALRKRDEGRQDVGRGHVDVLDDDPPTLHNSLREGAGLPGKLTGARRADVRAHKALGVHLIVQMQVQNVCEFGGETGSLKRRGREREGEKGERGRKSDACLSPGIRSTSHRGA